MLSKIGMHQSQGINEAIAYVTKIKQKWISKPGPCGPVTGLHLSTSTAVVGLFDAKANIGVTPPPFPFSLSLPQSFASLASSLLPISRALPPSLTPYSSP